MTNIETKMKDGKLTITVDLNKRFGPSGSGKSTIIATTSGNVVIDPKSGATMGLNIYTKKPAEGGNQQGPAIG